MAQHDDEDKSVAEEALEEGADLAEKGFSFGNKVRSKSAAQGGYGKKMHERRAEAGKKRKTEEERREAARQAARKHAEKIRQEEKKAWQTERETAQGVGTLFSKIREAANSENLGAFGTGFLLMIVVLVASSFASCAVLFGSAGGASSLSSYLSNDADMCTVDLEYENMEIWLRTTTSAIERDNPGRNEYQLDIAAIGHDPYDLAALLTVLYDGDYNAPLVAQRLQEILDAQYHLTTREVVERRTRTVTRWAWFTRYTEEIVDGEMVRMPYQSYESYEATETYNYVIYHAKLTNAGIDEVARSMGLTDDQLEWYDAIREALGNREDLFWHY